MKGKAELIFHPLRMRILQVLLRHGERTPAQIGEALGDVAPATLYRHLKQMLNGGIVHVVEERPVRGVVERVYAVDAAGASMTPEEVRAASPEAFVRHFAVFLAGLLDQFERYALQPDADLVRDGVGFRHFVIHATDDEFHALLQEVKQLAERTGRRKSGGTRRRRLLAGIAMPADSGIPEPG